jgi:transposase
VTQRTTNMNSTKPTSSCTPEGSTWDIGLDIGDRKTHWCVLHRTTGEMKEGSLKTDAMSFEEFFTPLKGSKVLLEVGSQSRWIQKFLKTLGLEAVTCEARKSSELNRLKRKNDRIDARTLANLLKANLPFLSVVEHRSDEEQRTWTMLQCRDALVETRTKLINMVRGVSKSCGNFLPWCTTEAFNSKSWGRIPKDLEPILSPVFTLLAEVNAKIEEYDDEIAKEAQNRPAAQLLMDIPGVGALTSVAFTVAIGNIRRFARSRDVGAYLGLVPKERSSGDSNPQLRISKRGNPYVRRLLVNAAHYTIGVLNKKDTDLRRWGLAHLGAGKNQKKRTVVAVARKLAVVMAAMLRSGKPYVPLRQDLGGKIPA